MMNFLRSIWPSTVPSQIQSSDEIIILRERILQSFSLIAFLIAAVIFVLSMPGFIEVQRYGLVAIYTISMILLGLITFIRRIHYLIRTVIALTIFFTIGAGSLFINGIEGSGTVILAGFVALSVIFLGTWPGVAAGSATLVTMLTMGLLLTQKFIAPPLGSLTEYTPPFSEWISHSLVLSLVEALFILGMTIIVNGLRRALLSQKQMGAELKKERDSLEERVVKRTTELERRAVEMETASQIAHDISLINNLDDLLANAVELIKNEYHLYYSAIFLVDEHKEFADLRSGSGEAGQTMLANKHRLRLGENSTVGFTITRQEYRLSQDVNLDAIHYKNPLLPETQSELALPLITNGEVIGALDIQSEIRQFFTPDDIRALQIAADQLAVAIDKARLVQQLNQTLDDLRGSYQQSTQQSWQGFLRATRRSFSFNYRQGKLEAAQMANLHAMESLDTGKLVINKQVDPATGKPFTRVAIPIKLRDQVLGVLDLRFETRMVPANMIEMLEAAANRLALALENARLLEEIQMRAAREHMVSNISAKVRAESEVDRVLQTVVTELGRSLGVSDVLVQLRGNEG